MGKNASTMTCTQETVTDTQVSYDKRLQRGGWDMNKWSAFRFSLLIALVLMQAGQVRAMSRTLREVSDANSEYSIVQTANGPLRGKRKNLDDGRSLEIFLGVPYAKPPTASLRFAAPQPAESWAHDGTRDALVHGNKCLQRIIPQDPPMTNVPFGEDCLVLDIYTVRRQGSNDDLLPTMLFLHGGGFYGGTGSLYNFTNLALMNVTVISIGYRLDVFGFLSTLDDVIPGNFGLLDQALALEWVKDNIQNFGGDPSDITLFGGSAGAASVSLLALSPLTRGKFQKAILQSGASTCSFAVHNEETLFLNPEKQAYLLGKELRCNLPDTGPYSRHLLNCFRNWDAESVINASVAVQMNMYQGAMIWTPVVETTFGVIPESPAKMLQNKKQLKPIPTMYGYTKEDGSWLIFDPENDGIPVIEFKRTLNIFLLLSVDAKVKDALYEDVVKTYLPNPDSMTPIEVRTALIDAVTDGYMVAPMVQEARWHSQYGGNAVPSYMFEWAYRPSYDTSPLWHGASHAAEKGFVLGLPVGPDPYKYPNHTETDATVARYVTTMWANFAKTGNPTVEPVGEVTWPKFSSGQGASEKLLVIDSKLGVKDIDRGERISVWLKHMLPSEDGGRNSGVQVQISVISLFLSVICLRLKLF